jgi:hypothetical protein
MGANGTTFVLSIVHSKTLGKQQAYMNGSRVYDGARTNDNQLGNMGLKDKGELPHIPQKRSYLFAHF